MTTPRTATLAALGVAGIAAAALATGSLLVGAAPASVDGTAQNAHPSQVQLACPTALVDPFNTSHVATAATWSSLSSAPVTPAPASITGTGGVIPTGLTLVGQGGGELAGLSAVGCAAPRTSQWIAVGATTSGADMVLILSNPGPTASVVSVDGYGAFGPLNAAPRQVTVAANSSVSVLLAGWFPDENSLAVHVQADGGGVSAWAQASLMNGEIPQGTTLASAIAPATTQTILGVDPKGTSLLRLVSPSGDAHVSVSVADSTGVHPLGGGNATVAAGSTLEMPLDGASKDSTPIALIVSSDREVVAQTTTITLGAPWAERANAWIMRSSVAPATLLTQAPIPGRASLETMASQVLSTKPIRQTSLETESGVSSTHASLLLYAPVTDGDEAVAQARDVWRPIARFGLIVVLIGGLGTALSGHIQGQEMVKVQPMKMAAAEGICVDTDGAAFTVAQFGSCPLGTDGTQPTQFIKVAGVASFMSHNSFTATSEGVADVQERMVTLLNSDPNFTAKYGDASQFDFRPPQMVTFWSFRFMIGLGMVAFLLAAWGLWATRGGKASSNKLLSLLALINLPLPFAAASFGWIFTEMGRQPWVVVPNQ